MNVRCVRSVVDSFRVEYDSVEMPFALIFRILHLRRVRVRVKERTILIVVLIFIYHRSSAWHWLLICSSAFLLFRLSLGNFHSFRIRFRIGRKESWQPGPVMSLRFIAVYTLRCAMVLTESMMLAVCVCVPWPLSGSLSYRMEWDESRSNGERVGQKCDKRAEPNPRRPIKICKSDCLTATDQFY